MNFPRTVIVEKSAGSLDSELKKLRLGEKCAVIFGSDVKKMFGKHIERNLLALDFHSYVAESIDRSYLEIFSQKLEDFDFIIGVGGGRAIDAAKYIAYISKKPWVSYPTVLSHDGIVSDRAILNEHGKKISEQAETPFAVIAELDVIKKAPYEYIAAGVGDVIANRCSVEDWKIADRAGKEKYMESIALHAIASAEAVENHIEQIKKMSDDGLRNLLWALISSSIAMNAYGSSRPCSGSEHNFSHALEELNAGSMHGQQVALGSIVMIYLQGGDWEQFREKMKAFKLPTNAKSIGIEADTLVAALCRARDVRERYTILNEKDVTNEEEAEKALRRVGII